MLPTLLGGSSKCLDFLKTLSNVEDRALFTDEHILDCVLEGLLTLEEVTYLQKVIDYLWVLGVLLRLILESFTLHR